jgi:hypothetical protein
MASDTALMTWKQLLGQLNKANVKDQENCWTILKEHEEYMESKGFRITINQVFAPEGELLWEY